MMGTRMCLCKCPGVGAAGAATGAAGAARRERAPVIPTIHSVLADSQESHEAVTRLRLERKNPRSIWAGRLLFLLSLSVVAIVLAWCAHFFLTSSEQTLAESQFESLTDRALAQAVQIAERNKWAISTMAEVVGQSQPNPEQWPFVTVPGFERIGLKLHASAGTAELLLMSPLVTPQQLPEWEAFAYDYLVNVEGHPINSIGAYNFIGKGVWSTSQNGTLIRDTTGIQPNSSHQVLFPSLQMQLTDDLSKLAFMYNMRSGPIRTSAIDTILEAKCSDRDEDYFNNSNNDTYPTHRCGAISDMVQIRGRTTRGPAAVLYQGIYPPGGSNGSNTTTYNRTNNGGQRLTGLLAVFLLLDETLDNIFADEVSGLDCVIRNQNSAFTYRIVDGNAVTLGDGDLHDDTYNEFRRSATLTDPNLYTTNSLTYTLEIYPTDEFYEVFKTSNPMVATIGAICVIFFAALFFLAFDFVVRQEFEHKSNLLEAKRRFMRYVSHEVRTPLNSVCMGLTLIERELESLLPSDDEGETSTLDQNVEINKVIPSIAKARECIELAQEILTMADSAVEVLSDLLNFDKIETGTMQLELSLVHIFKLVELTMNEFVLPAVKKSIKLKMQFQVTEEKGSQAKDIEGAVTFCVEKTEGLPTRARNLRAVADVIRIKQVFRNLVSNAVKFTPDGGTILVTTSWNEESKAMPPLLKASELGVEGSEDARLLQRGFLSVSVVDSGAGMDKEQLSQLFVAGTQFNANKLQGGGGSGLGLYIAKGIVEQHMGEMFATSDGIGRGTTLALKLPVYSVAKCDDKLGVIRCSTLSLPDTYHDHGDLENLSLKILVVDDAKTNRKLLARLLTTEGHLCDQAEDGNIAVKMVNQAVDDEMPYEVVLMDYEMPTMNGPSATRVIREAGNDVFVVGITGNILPEDIAHFRDCGANAVLPKPVRLPDLNNILMEHGLLVMASVHQSRCRTDLSDEEYEQNSPLKGAPLPN